MLQCEREEKTKTTVHIQKKKQLRCKMAISEKKERMNANKSHHLREFCGGGNHEPNNTLKNVKCGEMTATRPTRTNNVPPVSKGGAKDKKNLHHLGVGAASRQA